MKRVVLMTLKSPRFLYSEIDAASPDAYPIATRLAIGLWDSLPDNELLNQAASGRLTNAEQVRAQAARMIVDLRARGKLRDFFAHWLRTDRFEEMSKDSQKYPEFDAATISDLRESLDLFLDDVAGRDKTDGAKADFRQLLLADSVFLNGRLAKFYGIDMPEDEPFHKVTLESGERAGLLTHPYLLAGYAYGATTSPIHRGVFIARSVLGRGLRPPPEAVTPLPPELHADLTTRERISLQTNVRIVPVVPSHDQSAGLCVRALRCGRALSQPRSKAGRLTLMAFT